MLGVGWGGVGWGEGSGKGELTEAMDFTPANPIWSVRDRRHYGAIWGLTSDVCGSVRPSRRPVVAPAWDGSPVRTVRPSVRVVLHG